MIPYFHNNRIHLLTDAKEAVLSSTVAIHRAVEPDY